MSFTFTVPTRRFPAPAAVLDEVGREGLVWMEAAPEGPEWPEGVLHVGLRDRSVRGAELSREQSSLEVRVLTCASREDHDLALRFVRAFARAGEGLVAGEDGPTTRAEDLQARYDDAWVERQVASGPRTIRHLLREGKAITVPAFRRDVHLGPKTLARLGAGKDEASIDTAVLEVLRRAQWVDETRWIPIRALRFAAPDGSQLDVASWPEGVACLLPAVDRLHVQAGREAVEVDAAHLEAIAGDRIVEWLDDRQALVEAAEGPDWEAIVARAREREIPANRRAKRPWWKLWGK